MVANTIKSWLAGVHQTRPFNQHSALEDGEDDEDDEEAQVLARTLCDAPG